MSNDWPKDPSFRECNKLITSFKKLIPDPNAIADLMLYYVKQGCSLTAQFGDYDDPFYTALENNFNKAVKFISSNGLMPEYSPHMKKMIKSVECCGYVLLRQESGKVHERALSCPYRDMGLDTSLGLKFYKSIGKNGVQPCVEQFVSTCGTLTC